MARGASGAGSSRTAYRRSRALVIARFGAITPPPPATPSSVTVARSDGQLTANWPAVSNATHYHVTYSSDNGKSWSRAAFQHPDASITISGVDNSKTYIVGARAGNDGGWSGWRNSPAAGPYTPPTPTPTPTPAPTPPPARPAGLTATSGDGSVTLAWNDPVNSSITGYEYRTRWTGVAWSEWTAVTGNVTTATVTGLENGTEYRFKLRAVNASGTSRPAPAAAPWYVVATPTPPPPPPARPTGLSATAGDGSVTLAWNDPANSSITGYEYRVRWAGVAWSEWTTISGNVTTATVTGLTNGVEYRFKLRAVNVSGTGRPAPAASPWYVAATPTLPPPPAAPSNVSVNPSEDSLGITWDAVSEATGYDVRAKSAGASDWHDVASNVTGTSYTYTTSNTMDFVGVRARNANGVSAWSDVSRMPADDLLNVATGLSSGGASAQSVQAQSQLAAPTWGTITRDLRRGMKEGNGFIYINWTGSSGATGYNVVCSTGGWYWHKCGWDNDGTVTYTSVPSGESQPVKFSHYRREVYNPGDYVFRNSRSYLMSIRAVNANPSDASVWVHTPDIHPVFPRLDDFTATRTDGQVTLSWTPNFWTTGYDIYCDNYTSGEDSDYTLCATLTNQDDTAASHSVTITKSGGTHNWSAFDDAGIIDIAIDSKNTWSKARWLPPLINPVAELTVSNIGVTTATLTIGNHSDAWYYKANAAPDNTCKGPVNAGTSAKDLTGLSAHTSYDYTAYSDSACTSANELATAARFTTLSSVSNLGSTKGGGGDIDGSNNLAVAFTTGPASKSPGGYVLKSVILPLRDSADRVDGMTLTLHEMQGGGTYTKDSVPQSTAVTGATFSGTFPTDNVAWTDTTFTCSGSGCKLDADSTYFVVAVRNGAAAYQWAWAATETEVALPSNNGWSVGYGHYQPANSTWRTYSTPDWNIAEFAFAHAPTLTSSSVTGTGATLTIANHDGDWWYEQSGSGGDNVCRGPVSGTSVTLSGLTTGTVYAYNAYSDSACAEANKLADTTFTTP